MVMSILRDVGGRWPLCFRRFGVALRRRGELIIIPKARLFTLANSTHLNEESGTNYWKCNLHSGSTLVGYVRLCSVLPDPLLLKGLINEEEESLILRDHTTGTLEEAFPKHGRSAASPSFAGFGTAGPKRNHGHVGTKVFSWDFSPETGRDSQLTLERVKNQRTNLWTRSGSSK